MSMSVDQETLDKLCSYIERIECAQKRWMTFISDQRLKGLIRQLFARLLLFANARHTGREGKSLLILYRMAMADSFERSTQPDR